jgi:Xaa-Pro aminopeptidase
LEVTNAISMHPELHESAGYDEGGDPIGHLLEQTLKLQPGCVGVQSENERTTPLDANRLYKGLASSCTLVDISTVVRAMRSPKSHNELSLMRRAGELCAASMNAALEGSYI